MTGWRAWAAAALLLLVALAGGFAWFLGEAIAEPEQPDRRTDAIVVLTGGAERVETGLALLEAGLAPRLLVSACLLYTSPSPRDRTRSRMPSSA